MHSFLKHQAPKLPTRFHEDPLKKQSDIGRDSAGQPALIVTVMRAAGPPFDHCLGMIWKRFQMMMPWTDGIEAPMPPTAPYGGPIIMAGQEGARPRRSTLIASVLPMENPPPGVLYVWTQEAMMHHALTLS
jgi:hypothetical protein